MSQPTQRRRLLGYLKACGSITTVEARSALDIMEPGTRICELRRQGASIATTWTTAPTANGGLRRIARYVLLTGEAANE